MARVSAPSARTARLVMSTTLKRRGGLAAGSAGGAVGRRLRGTKSGLVSGSGCLTTLSSGTICAPVPFVSVSRTQTLPIGL